MKRNKIIGLLNEQVAFASTHRIVNEEKDIMNKLEKLKLSKEETTKWFIKSETLERDLKMLEKAYHRQINLGKQLKEDVIRLKKCK